MIKYIGSKRTLVPTLVGVIGGLSGARSVIDLFSGTSRVGHGLKAAGLRVVANDHNAYAATLARCYVAADAADHADAAAQLAALSALPGAPGYFTRTFCEESRFFQPHNGARIDAIRTAIDGMSLSEERRAVLLVSLMEAADRVDSTTGVQMAYLKQWAPRASRELTLRMPALLPRAAAGKGEAHQLDALVAAERLSADVAYLDPPYNQHKYLGNYHIWETLIRWDAPDAYGVARKRTDCRDRKSPFNSRRAAADALRRIVETIDARHLVVSFSDEGYIPRPQMEELLSARGEVTVLVNDFRRYVGAQIGIYSPDGEKVGAVSHLRNKEFIYVVRGR